MVSFGIIIVVITTIIIMNTPGDDNNNNERMKIDIHKMMRTKGKYSIGTTGDMKWTWLHYAMFPVIVL